MGLVFLLIGLLLIVTGMRGTYAQFGSQVVSDLGGDGGFLYWGVAVVGVGAVGFIPALQQVSRLLIALVIISIFLSHKGFFAKFQQALQTGPTPPAPIPGGTNPAAGSLGELAPSNLFNQPPASMQTPGGGTQLFPFLPSWLQPPPLPGN